MLPKREDQNFLKSWVDPKIVNEMKERIRSSSEENNRLPDFSNDFIKNVSLRPKKPLVKSGELLYKDVTGKYVPSSK